jgi:hypothetical protein
MKQFVICVLTKYLNRDEITGEWSRLCNEAVRDLCPHEVPEQGRDNRGVGQTV